MLEEDQINNEDKLITWDKISESDREMMYTVPLEEAVDQILEKYNLYYGQVSIRDTNTLDTFVEDMTDAFIRVSLNLAPPKKEKDPSKTLLDQ